MSASKNHSKGRCTDKTPSSLTLLFSVQFFYFVEKSLERTIRYPVISSDFNAPALKLYREMY